MQNSENSAARLPTSAAAIVSSLTTQVPEELRDWVRLWMHPSLQHFSSGLIQIQKAENRRLSTGSRRR
eukprot:m.126723 g.126723  ORF g.126723 m.126723 type:complete len:68 (+) comp22197_c0_seq15:1631-1834(+)